MRYWDAVNRNGVPYAIMHNLLFTLPMQEALSQLRTGKVGKPILGRGQCMGMKPSDFAAIMPILRWPGAPKRRSAVDVSLIPPIMRSTRSRR